LDRFVWIESIESRQLSKPEIEVRPGLYGIDRIQVDRFPVVTIAAIEGYKSRSGLEVFDQVLLPPIDQD
jgi:hypothetical protein